MDISDYTAEIMKQNLTDPVGANLTKLGFMFFLKENRYVIQKTNVKVLFSYAYRFLIDNYYLSKKTANVLIQNLKHYRLIDLYESFMESLKEWITIGNNVMLSDGEFIYTNESLQLSNNDKNTLDRVVSMICKKTTSQDLNYVSSLKKESLEVSKLINQPSEYLNYMKNSRFFNRCLENIDYCSCCDEANLSKLYPVHLNFRGDLADTRNLIFLCYDHAILYMNNYFHFDKHGKIKILQENPLLDNRMRISSKIMLCLNLKTILDQ